ncbi:hypothetical protein M2191_000149 [Bradyrhizobium japonicum]|nr:hypothetical protein [Bradyrhizobium japonicum]
MTVKSRAMLTGVNQMAAEAGATWQRFLDFSREASIFDTELPRMPGHKRVPGAYAPKS